MVAEKSDLVGRDLTKADIEEIEGKGYDGIIVGSPIVEVICFHSDQVYVYARS
jgi:tryptophan synthase alpha subunit